MCSTLVLVASGWVKFHTNPVTLAIRSVGRAAASPEDRGRLLPISTGAGYGRDLVEGRREAAAEARRDARGLARCPKYPCRQKRIHGATGERERPFRHNRAADPGPAATAAAASGKTPSRES